MKMICPHCGVAGSAPGSQAGDKVRCPQCEKVFLVTERKVACPHCAVTGAVGDSVEGAKLRCPQCGKIFLLTRDLLAGWRPADTAVVAPTAEVVDEMAVDRDVAEEPAGESPFVAEAPSSLAPAEASELEALLEEVAEAEPEAELAEEVAASLAEESVAAPIVEAAEGGPVVELEAELEREPQPPAPVEAVEEPEEVVEAEPEVELVEEVAASLAEESIAAPVMETEEEVPVVELEVELEREPQSPVPVEVEEVPEEEVAEAEPEPEMVEEAPQVELIDEPSVAPVITEEELGTPFTAGEGAARAAQMASEAIAQIEPVEAETPVVEKTVEALPEESVEQGLSEPLGGPLTQGEKAEETEIKDATEPAVIMAVCAGCGESFQPELLREIGSQPFCAVCQLRLAAVEEKEKAPSPNGRLRGALAAIVLLGILALVLFVLMKLGLL